MSVVWGGDGQWEGEKRLRVWVPPAGRETVRQDRTWRHRGSPLRVTVPAVDLMPVPVSSPRRVCQCRGCRMHRSIRRMGDGMEVMGAYLLSDAPAVKAATWSIILGTCLFVAGEWVYVLGVAGR